MGYLSELSLSFADLNLRLRLFILLLQYGLRFEIPTCGEVLRACLKLFREVFLVFGDLHVGEDARHSLSRGG